MPGIRGKNRNAFDSQSMVCRSKRFKDILLGIENNSNLTNRKLFEEVILPLDNKITYGAFLYWLKKYREKKRELVDTVVKGTIMQDINKELGKKQFFLEIDSLAREKLADPEARANISLRDALAVKIDTEKIKQKDEEIQLKRAEEDRKSTMFDILIAEAMSGKMTEGEVNNKLVQDNNLACSNEQDNNASEQRNILPERTITQSN